MNRVEAAVARVFREPDPAAGAGGVPCEGAEIGTINAQDFRAMNKKERMTARAADWFRPCRRGFLAGVLLGAALHRAAVPAVAEDAPPMPTVEAVVDRMVKADDQRLAALNGYSATRRYRLENQRFHKQGEMTVSMVCSSTGVKTFTVLSESGSGIVRSRVLRKMIEAEAEASQQRGRQEHRILPKNYDFRLTGMGASAGRPSYVIEIVPKTQNKFLIRGRIWVDAEEYAITRIEGSPAKNPSFWTRSIQVVHRYGKAGPFWLPVSNASHAEARIFGRTDVTIEYFDYLVNGKYRTDARDASIDAGRTREPAQ